MTALADLPGEVDVRLEQARTRNRVLTIISAILALALVGLGSWILYDVASGPTVPTEVNEVIDDYLQAWVGRDQEALRAATTEDFVINEYQYKWGVDEIILHEIYNDDVEGIISIGFLFPWEIELVGDLHVAGEDPWFVTVEENWAQNLWHYDGMATYVVIDDGGTLKIANHYWTGLRYNETQIDPNES